MQSDTQSLSHLVHYPIGLEEPTAVWAFINRLRSRSPPNRSPVPSVDETPDEVLSLLSTSRRRQVIRIVGALDTAGIDHSTLAERIAAAENDVEVHDLTCQQRKRVYISLTQSHIKKLLDANIIEERGREQVYYPTDRTADLLEWVRVIDDATGGEF